MSHNGTYNCPSALIAHLSLRAFIDFIYFSLGLPFRIATIADVCGAFTTCYEVCHTLEIFCEFFTILSTINMFMSWLRKVKKLNVIQGHTARKQRGQDSSQSI